VLAGHSSQLPVWAGARAFAKDAGLETGIIATLETVTTDPARALGIEAQFGARAEAMEGAGVVHAALRHGVPAFEIRAISNMVGPRDPSRWKTREALEALSQTLETHWEGLQDKVIEKYHS
jgi:futalosine hydrolase